MKMNRHWLWVPTLYMAEGIPYILVNNISVALFTAMGVSNGQMALFTSMLYLPWVIKPLWSPFVDILKSKRWWIIATQIILTACFIGLTLSMPHPTAEEIALKTTDIHLFSVMLIIFWITAFTSATHDIAADGYYMLALNETEQAAFVGIRSTFYRIATILGQGMLIYMAGRLTIHTDAPYAWQVTLLTASVIAGVLTIWHTRVLPKAEEDKSKEQANVKEVMRQTGEVFISFFKKKGIALAIVFMLLFRLPEALSLKMIYPFMMGSREAGGLGLGLDQIGIIYSTIGMIFLTIGGILGGIYIARAGLKKAIWWMAASLTLPDLVFVYMSMAQPTSTILITILLAIEQAGYGFGFTAYMMYMIHVSDGEYKTAHYALCTAFMALSMMLPGMVAGYIEEAVGYVWFFWIVMACCMATVAVSGMIKRRL